MSVRNRKNPPPPPKSANLAGNYRMIGISAVKAAARYGGSCKGPHTRRPVIRALCATTSIPSIPLRGSI
jgi:hypothetical protein